MLSFDPVQTVACGGLFLIAGYAIRRHVPVLARFSIPAPVIGGLLVALAMLVCHRWDVTPVRFDTQLEQPLMIAFFTSIGFNASASLLKVGGRQILLFLALATFIGVVQNLAGIGLAGLFGLPPLFGVITGSVTLMGGPATGMAFAPLFTAAGVHGAASVALANAMAGIVLGSVIGAPVATMLIERLRLRQMDGQTAGPAIASDPAAAGPEAATALPVTPSSNDEQVYTGLRSFVFVLIAMAVGAWISGWVHGLGIILPSYIGAMLIGALIRNLDDRYRVFGLSPRSIDVIGNVSLSLFLVIALMNLHLWDLSGLALPLLVTLAVQTVIVVAFCCWPLLQLMGRDYDAAVMASGFIGFMLGTTANAVAAMSSLTERYGAAPRAFLVAPIVGAFLMDFTNALIITGFVNFLK